MSNNFTTPSASQQHARNPRDVIALVLSFLALAASGACVIAIIITIIELNNLHNKIAALEVRLTTTSAIRTIKDTQNLITEADSRASQTNNTDTRAQLYNLARSTNESFKTVSVTLTEMKARITKLEAQTAVALPAPDTENETKTDE